MKKQIDKEKLLFEMLHFDDISTIKALETAQNIDILPITVIENEFNSNTSFYYVVRLKKEIIGYINFSIVLDTLDLNSIVVKKEYQHLGIATFMLNKLLEVSNKKKVKTILLEVRKSNIQAQKLYIKFGFKHISTREKYYKDNLEDAYIFKKKL